MALELYLFRTSGSASAPKTMYSIEWKTIRNVLCLSLDYSYRFKSR